VNLKLIGVWEVIVASGAAPPRGGNSGQVPLVGMDVVLRILEKSLRAEGTPDTSRHFDI